MTRKTQNIRDRKFGFILTTLTALGLAAAAPCTFAQTIFVDQVGTGSGALTSAATATFLDEFSVAGISLGQIALPTTATATGNRALTNSGTATSEGELSLSSDGNYILLGGYNATVGTTPITSTTSAADNRVAGIFSIANGTIDTTTSLSDAFSGSNIRTVVSPDGSNIYVGGVQSAGSTGVRYATDNATTSTDLGTANPANVRDLGIFNNQLYASSGGSTSGTNKYDAGIYAIGSSLPTSGGQTTSIFLDLGVSGTPNPYGFYISPDGNTVYVADQTTGISKYTFSSMTSSFSLAYSTSTIAGLTGLSGSVVNGNLALYTVSPSTLYSVTDTGSALSLGMVALAPTNTAFRGVAFAPNDIVPAPEPSSFVAMFIGAGAIGLLVVRRRVGMKTAA